MICEILDELDEMVGGEADDAGRDRRFAIPTPGGVPVGLLALAV